MEGKRHSSRPFTNCPEFAAMGREVAEGDGDSDACDGQKI